MRRTASLLAAVGMLALPAAASADGGQSWAHEHIDAVVGAGLMAPSVEEFRPEDPLTRGEFAEILTAITGTEHTVRKPERPVKVRQLDKKLVQVLGLAPAAREIRSKLASAGLKPPRRLGSETVARLLRFRYNHPADEDARELLPNDTITRAEAAFSVARVLELEDWHREHVTALAASLAVPELSDWQRVVLSRALRFVGFPYVWGGYSEGNQAPFGTLVSGGFDCSGLIWRVYKTEPFSDAPSLGESIEGRTTYTMSGEVRRRQRIPAGEIQPGDILFFGPRGRKSKPREIGHSAIYLGGGWFVHASRHGTTIHPLTGWYGETLAWARRPLAEAGLA